MANDDALEGLPILEEEPVSDKAALWALSQRQIKHPAAYRILVALGRLANDAGEVTISQAALAKVTALHRATVVRQLQDLADRGYLSRERRFDPATGERTIDDISLNFHQHEQVCWPEEPPMSQKPTLEPTLAPMLEKPTLDPPKKTNDFGPKSENATASKSHIDLDSSDRSQSDPPPRPRATRANPGTPVPDDFEPDDASSRFVLSLGFGPEDMAELVREFVDYWSGVPGARGLKLNWQGTFRNSVKLQKQWQEERDARRPATIRDTVTRAAKEFLRRGQAQTDGGQGDGWDPGGTPGLESKWRH